VRLFGLRDDGTIVFANATLRQMLGYNSAPDELTGQPITTILPAASRVFYQTHFFPVLKLRGRAEEVYLSLRSKTGDDVPVLANAAVVVNGGAANGVAGAVVNQCVFVPMRQRGRFEAEILQAKRAAEEAGAQLRARADREALLNRVGQALRASTDPETIQAAAATALAEALGADRCFYARYDLARDHMAVGRDWHRAGLSSLSGEYRLRELALLPERLYRSDAPLVIEDVRSHGNGSLPAKAARRLEALGVRAAAGVGLFGENGRLMASLTVAMAQSARAWTADQVSLIATVATQTRSAIEEARLRERERNIAERLQDALRPVLPDPVAGFDVKAHYEPALEEASIGGDFFDVFSLDDKRSALVVADLSGKGLAAAAQIATVRHMLRTLLYQQGTTALARAVRTVNDLLTEHELLSGFATLFVGVYDADRLALTFVNAGQEPGLLLRAATGQVEQLESTGALLGGFPGANYEERRLCLASGDTLAVFTDGLTEAGPTRQNFLEVDGVARLLQQSVSPRSTAAGIVSRLMAGVKAFATPEGIRDDVCLLVARFNKRDG
jgi:serine phosphatase RsbU (regulator of sigma subunit)